MDKNILEFWGNAFLNAARNQKQLEDLNKFFGQNVSGENSLLAPFLSAYGWQKPADAAPDELFELTKKATDAFKEFSKAYLVMFDIVSKEDYVILSKENEHLKERIAEQDKIISDLKRSSGKEGFDQEEVVGNLTKIVKSQTQQFQELMKQIGEYYQKDLTGKKK
jgi:hypothetical protein